MIEKQDAWLAVTLDDYGCPPICSGSLRMYAGTAGMIQDFLARLSERSQAGEYEAGLADAFRRYQEGDREAKAWYYMTEARAFYPLTPCHTAHVEQRDWSMDFVNAWHCIYQLRADAVEADVVYAEMEGQYCRFVSAGFQNAYYIDDLFEIERNCPLGETLGFWGHPAVLEKEGKRTFSRLFYREREFADREEMEADIREPTPIDYSDFFFDVFGDG